MKTRKYKTLEGLIRQSYHKELNFNDFKRGGFFQKKSGWCNFTLPDEERELAVRLFANAVYNRVTDKQLDNIKYYNGPNYGILGRLTITKKPYDKEVRGDYCVGQDYDAEIRTIQGIFRKGR